MNGSFDLCDRERKIFLALNLDQIINSTKCEGTSILLLQFMGEVGYVSLSYHWHVQGLQYSLPQRIAPFSP